MLSQHQRDDWGQCWATKEMLKHSLVHHALCKFLLIYYFFRYEFFVHGLFRSEIVGGVYDSTWIHIVYNYHPNHPKPTYDEIRIYHNGQSVYWDTWQPHFPSTNHTGKVLVVGRLDTRRAGEYHYCSMKLDELVFFNHALSITEIRALGQTSN